MAELKTKKTNASVSAFLLRMADPEQRKDCRTLARMMGKATGAKPKMWGGSIVGFGSYHYEYASGRQGDWFMVGFSPRKQSLSIYLLDWCEGWGTLVGKLGKHRTGKACLYVKRLSDVDVSVLDRLIRQSVRRMRKRSKR